MQGYNDGIPSVGAYNYFTYLAPGTDFTQRWLVRRPLQVGAAMRGAGERCLA